MRATNNVTASIPVATRSMASVCGRSLAGTKGSNLAGGMDVCCECCGLSGIEVSVSGCSLVQMSPTDRGVSECHREASIMRKPWPSGGCCAMGGGIASISFISKITSYSVRVTSEVR